jgi:hypothetical protein
MTQDTESTGLEVVRALAQSPVLDVYCDRLAALSAEILTHIGREDLASQPFYRGVVVGAMQARQDEVRAQAAEAMALGGLAYREAAARFDERAASDASGVVDEPASDAAAPPARTRPRRGRPGRG